MARYRPNNSMKDGLGGFMMDPTKTGKIAMIVARKVALQAKANVLADHDVSMRATAGLDDEGGQLADSFEVDQVTVLWGEEFPNPRLAAIVKNDTRYAARYEFGARPGHKGAHHSLRRAGGQFGELRGPVAGD